MASRNEVSAKPCGLMRLPLEIRRTVYREAICTENLVDTPDPLDFVTLFGKMSVPRDCPFKGHPIRRNMALLRASRQICLEATAVLYGLTTFYFQPLFFEPFDLVIFEPGSYEAGFPRQCMNLIPFLKMIGKNNRRLLRKIKIEHDYGDEPPWERTNEGWLWGSLGLLSDAKPFLTLEINCNYTVPSAFRHYTDVARSLREDRGECACGDKYCRALAGFKSLKGIYELYIKPPSARQSPREYKDVKEAAQTLMDYIKVHRTGPARPELLFEAAEKRVVDIQAKVHKKRELEFERSKILALLQQNLDDTHTIDSDISGLL